jgi:hypothetical protein
MSGAGWIGRPGHRLLTQWLSVDAAYTGPVRPFLYDTVWRLYNLRHYGDSNALPAQLSFLQIDKLVEAGSAVVLVRPLLYK